MALEALAQAKRRLAREIERHESRKKIAEAVAFKQQLYRSKWWPPRCAATPRPAAQPRRDAARCGPRARGAKRRRTKANARPKAIEAPRGLRPCRPHTTSTCLATPPCRRANPQILRPTRPRPSPSLTRPAILQDTKANKAAKAVTKGTIKANRRVFNTTRYALARADYEATARESTAAGPGAPRVHFAQRTASRALRARRCVCVSGPCGPCAARWGGRMDGEARKLGQRAPGRQSSQ